MAIGDGIDMVVRCYRLKGARLAENESEGGGVALAIFTRKLGEYL